MRGSVVTSSPQGAAIASTHIVELVASPTLENPSYLTIFDADNSIQILNFQTSSLLPNQVDFEFEWRGTDLRCDVVADIDALVRVEFEATEPLLLAAASSNRFSHKALLDNEDMRMSESILISADPTAAITPSTPATGAEGSVTTQASTGLFSRPIVIGIIAGLSVLIVAVFAYGVFYIRRKAAAAPAAPTTDVALAA